MQLFMILRRDGWNWPYDLEASVAHSRKVAEEEMAGEVRWIRSYVLDEGGRGIGTVCLFEATDPEAIRRHGALTDMPVDEIVAINDTLVMRPDPHPADLTALPRGRAVPAAVARLPLRAA